MNIINKVKLIATLSFIIGVCVGAVGGLLVGYTQAKPDIEIYTPHDIIYVNDLTVSFETRDTIISFSSRGELKEYISDITAEHANEN